MILFFGYRDDDAIRLAIEATSAIGVAYAFVDQRNTSETDLAIWTDAAGVDGELVVSHQTLRLCDVRAVYARPLAAVPQGDPRASERAVALLEDMTSWLDATTARVVSRPCAMASNGSKPFQAQIIAASGFAVPETLVTSDPAEAREFWARHGEVIFKSTSGIRSIVRRLDERRASSLDRLSYLPTQFQALVKGTDVRVHVVDNEVFATEVQSAAVDYRYARRDGLAAELCAVDLPTEVKERCVRLAKHLALPLAGIDLRRQLDGSYVCFEVNPMPGYSYYQAHTGQPIASSLARYLANAG